MTAASIGYSVNVLWRVIVSLGLAGGILSTLLGALAVFAGVYVYRIHHACSCGCQSCDDSVRFVASRRWVASMLARFASTARHQRL